MTASSSTLRLLKILSIAGLVINSACVVAVLLWGIFDSDADSRFWPMLWVGFTIGLPMYGILYVLLKQREYLRDIKGTQSH
ncbi:MAG: hypothetical protein FJX56_05175 [Alphaproteobacteria bacterium]|nr:hypothetical protein [Alphaproteobacteria bacterium]